VEKVDVNAKLVDRDGVATQEIVESIRRVTDSMGEIIAANEEQSPGREQLFRIGAFATGATAFLRCGQRDVQPLVTADSASVAVAG
jgi:hypothetical protein